MLILRPKEICPYTSICSYYKGCEIVDVCWGSKKDREHQFTCKRFSNNEVIASKMKNFDINKINQIINGKFIGYHDNMDKFGIKKGDIVTIKKGTIYHTMKDGNHYMTKRTHKIKVNHMLHGAQYIHNGKIIIQNMEIRWAGSGGYWHSVDINDVIN